MNNTQISLSAKNYADALVKLGQDGKISYDDIYKNLEVVKEITASSQELVNVLENPTIADDTKYSIIDEVFKNQIDVKIIDFLKILIEKKRFNEFNGIVEAYRVELDKINNIKRVEVTSAVELNEETRQRIINKLQNKLKKNVIAEWIINDEIIGGLVIKIDDDVVDSSLKNKLESLSKNLSL